MTSREKYTKHVVDACNEMKLDYFPQVEASDLLYKVITLEDIYLPLSLEVTNSLDLQSSSSVDDLIRRIDEKLAAFANNETHENNVDYFGNSETFKSNTHSQEWTMTSLDPGLRILIEANPGSGKTTFCKRLVLAMINKDESFFKKYSEENDLSFSSNALPVLISCKNIADYSADELSALSFRKLMYRLCLLGFGPHFSEITEDEFMELTDSSESYKLCIILDGWDEILDPEKAGLFLESLNAYLKQNPYADTIITIRASYVAPELCQPYSSKCRIQPLSDDDIREFCKKWYEVILSSDQQRAKNYASIAETIISSNDLSVREMMSNPLDLSLLLTVSKNDGRLPENKAELFNELVDLYIFWSRNKRPETLSAKSIRVFLAYIASMFTEKNDLYCGEQELLRLISQAMIDLEWAFSENISSFDPYGIAKELSHTGILTRTYDGNRFSFSESQKGTHRQMQEYLTAYAIQAQYSDEEYNNMQPIEIFEDKYDKRQWREVMLFIALMNNGRLRQDLVRRLISKAENNAYCANLLFDFIVNGVNIQLADKHKIYNLNFTKSIFSDQVDGIFMLVTRNNKSSADFIEYISTMFATSEKNGNYGYEPAKALIEATLAIKKGQSPFVHAEALMRSSEDDDIIVGSIILHIMAWCKNDHLNNKLSDYAKGYYMPLKWIKLYKSLIMHQRATKYLLKSVRAAVVANFASFSDFFDGDSIIHACNNISNPEKAEECEYILSIAPVFDSLFPQPDYIDPNVKLRYFQKLKYEMIHKDYYNISFSFCICASLMCFSQLEKIDIWRSIDSIYNHYYLNNAGTRHHQNLSYPFHRMLSVSKSENLISNPQHDYISWNLVVLKENSYAIYSKGQKQIKMIIPSGGLTPDAKDFLRPIIIDSLSSYNNCAYLLRRHELEALKTGPDYIKPISQEQLLAEGIAAYDELSVINYALSIAGIYVNEKGNYSAGKEYLISIKTSLDPKSIHWIDVQKWNSKLLFERNEFEGLVVLTWLFAIDLLNLNEFYPQTLRLLSIKLQEVSSIEEDFALFNKSILETIQ